MINLAARGNKLYNNRTIYLINPPLNNFMSKYSNDHTFPPLGLLSIATDIKNKTQWNTRVYDAEITSFNEIANDMQRDKPAVVGLSVLAETYNSSLEFAKLAKKMGAITLFGNDQAALLGKNILKKQPIVDAICTAEHGENMAVPFLEALENGTDLDTVPEMMYRNDRGEIMKSSAKAPPLEGKYKMDRYPIVDRSLLPQSIWDVYLENYKKTYGFMHPNDKITGCTTINKGRGCPRLNNRCKYCGILDLTIKLSSPCIFWQEIEDARNKINANIFYEAFDSMSSVPWWIKFLIQSRPEHLADTKFITYAQAREVNEKLVGLFKELGAVMINMGLDSGDDTILKRLKSPNDSLAANINAVKLINEAGMHVFCSFVLGGPGESIESLQNTIDFTKWLADNKLAAAIEAQPLMPRKKAKIGDWFDQPKIAALDMAAMGLTMKNEHLLHEISDKWNNEDIVDTPLMSDIYARVFTTVTYQRLVEAANEIVSYAKTKGIGSGSVGIKVEPQQ